MEIKNSYEHKRVKPENATWPEFDENGNIIPENKNLRHEEKEGGNLEKAEKPEKIYYFEDPDSDRSQHGERGALGERGTFSVFYDPEQKTYLKNHRHDLCKLCFE